MLCKNSFRLLKLPAAISVTILSSSLLLTGCGGSDGDDGVDGVQIPFGGEFPETLLGGRGHLTDLDGHPQYPVGFDLTDPFGSFDRFRHFDGRLRGGRLTGELAHEF